MESSKNGVAEGSWKKVAETFTLLLSLFLLLPSIPSAEHPIDIFPIGLFAALAFAVSRLLRYRSAEKKALLLSIELFGFFIVVFAMNKVANILLNTSFS